VRIKGWMGRADQSTKVAGDVRHPGAGERRDAPPSRDPRRSPVVEGEAGNDRMTLKCEARDRPAGLAEAIVASIREVTKLRGEVELVSGAACRTTAGHGP